MVLGREKSRKQAHKVGNKLKLVALSDNVQSDLFNSSKASKQLIKLVVRDGVWEMANEQNTARISWQLVLSHFAAMGGDLWCRNEYATEQGSNVLPKKR